MGTWSEVIHQIREAPNQFDSVRTQYLEQLTRYRNRNVIAYYSSFLHKNEYDSSIIDACQKAIDWSEITTARWLSEVMFREMDDADSRASIAVDYLSSRNTHFAHERHIGIDEARTAGLQIEPLEDDQELQELIITIHHAFSHTLQQTNAIKIVENHNGTRLVNNVR